MRMIVTVGWAIYPLGYIFGYLTGGVDANSLNVIYNAADFLNKIAFGLIIWAAAMQQPGMKGKRMEPAMLGEIVVCYGDSSLHQRKWCCGF